MEINLWLWKTTFFRSLLHEIPVYNGPFKIDGQEANKNIFSVVYVEQEPFIFPETINTIFCSVDHMIKSYIKSVLCILQEIKISKCLFLQKIGSPQMVLHNNYIIKNQQNIQKKLSIPFTDCNNKQTYIYWMIYYLLLMQILLKGFFRWHSKNLFLNIKQREILKKKAIVISVTRQIQYAIQCEKRVFQMTELSKKKQVVNSTFFKKKIIQNLVANNLVGNEADQQQLITLRMYFRYYQYWNVIIILFVLDLTFEQIIIKEFFQFFKNINKKMILILQIRHQECLLQDCFFEIQQNIL
ncbi:unnamed protein product [Paramecium primaurelia]|uniref:Transmembrane protein n=1 Tax=Paramecium primaurelia TaxID=5886 RepID=A0A8S1MRH6_PARPR|nr:unnamed protein product [Paramecium primaurelia]